MSDANANLHWSDCLATPQAQQLYKDFQARYRKRQDEVRTTSLVILVWGPGTSGGDLYQKRLQIRDHLLGRGHVALFSEELDQDVPAPDLPSHVRELLQACEADFIIVIQASPGSTAEVHDFVGIDEVARKMVVFIDERHKEGYSYTGALQGLAKRYHTVHTFTYPDDIDKCCLLGAVLDKVQALQWAKFRLSLAR